MKVYFLLLKCILPKLNRRIIKSASSIQLPISSLSADKKGLPDKTASSTRIWPEAVLQGSSAQTVVQIFC